MRRCFFLILAAGLWLGTPLDAEIVVPLQVDTVTTLGGGQKLAVGLYVGVGGGAPRLYQLDTGNGSFISSYSGTLDGGVSQWWGSDVDVVGSQSGSSSFGGRTVFYNTVNAGIALFDGANGNQLIQSAGRMTVAQAPRANVEGTSTPTDWESQTQAGEPALLGQYYGNFGAGLFSSNSSQGLYPILGQLTDGSGDKIRGYAISLGNLASGTNPAMTLYFDSDFADGNNPVAGFTMSTDLLAGGDIFPNTGYATADEHPLQVTRFEVEGEFVQDTENPFHSLPDTGGESLEIPDSGVFDPITNGDGIFHSGLNFHLTLPDSNGSDSFTLGFETGDMKSINEVAVTDPAAHYNLGLDLYNYYDVYFDVAGSTMRFRSAVVPEPSSLVLVLGAAAFFGMACRRCRGFP